MMFGTATEERGLLKQWREVVVLAEPVGVAESSATCVRSGGHEVDGRLLRRMSSTSPGRTRGALGTKPLGSVCSVKSTALRMDANSSRASWWPRVASSLDTA